MDIKTTFILYDSSSPVTWGRRAAAWLVHAFTGWGSVLGLLMLYEAYQHNFIMVFWLMSAAIVIDGVDGIFARMVKVKTVLPEFDGGLLDNIIDYVTYVMVPAFMILIGEFVPESLRLITGCIIVFSSAYQFCQVEAKTEDHFFKGFPSY